MTRRVGLVLSIALVAWAAVAVPMPFQELRPGSTHEVEQLVRLGTPTTEVNGDLELLTVRQTRPNILEALWVAVDPGRRLAPADDGLPPGLDRDRYRDIQRDAFRTSFLTAVAVAAEQAGIEVELRTRAVVAQVLPGAPSDGLLVAGDVIEAIDGTAVASGEGLVEQLGRSDEERPVTLTVRRDGEQRTLTVQLRRLPETDRPVLGIVVETLAEDPELPFSAELEETGILGPSAGMMLALATTDLLLEEDLAHGRHIAGTGTIDARGRIGPVGGVEQKATAAVDAGVDLLLVPVEQLDEAAAATAAGIQVVGVATFQDVLDAVRGDPDAVAAP